MTEIQGRITDREFGAVIYSGNTPFKTTPACIVVAINDADLARLDPTRPIIITQEEP